MSPIAVMALTSGWSGLSIGFGLAQASVLAGLFWGGAGGGQMRKILRSPFMALGAMAAAGMTMSLAKPLLLGLGIASGGFGHLGIALVANLAIGFFAGRMLARMNASGDVHRRGTVVLDEDEAHAARRDQEKIISREKIPEHEQRLPPVTLAGMPLTRNDETMHFRIVGTTGSGKTTAIKEVIDGALARGDRAIIADPEGDYIKRYYDPKRGDKILSPFNKDSKLNWDLFAEIKDLKDIHELAFSLIPDTGSNSSQEWREYARTFFIAATHKLWIAGNEEKKMGIANSRYHTVKELYRVLTREPIEGNEKDGTMGLATLLEGTAAEPFISEDNVKMFGSIRAITGSLLRAFEYIGNADGEQFSVRRWVEQGKAGNGPKQGGVLFIPYKAGEISALKSIISTWMRLGIISAMEKEPEKDQRLWFVVDELDALGKINGLKDALVRLRKFGGRCVLGFQSISQVSTTYGPGEGQTIVENCRNTMILNSSNSQGGGTSEFASRLIGEREGIRTMISRSRQDGRLLGSTTKSEQYFKEAAVLPSEIEQLRNLRGYYNIASRPEWIKGQLEYKKSAANPALSVPRADTVGPASNTEQDPTEMLIRGFGPPPKLIKPKEEQRQRTAGESAQAPPQNRRPPTASRQKGRARKSAEKGRNRERDGADLDTP